jgi:anti-sigma factor RsiW
MRCLDVQMALEAYADGELGPEQAALLEQHLAGCDSCRAELARAQAVVAALETWPLVAEPANLAARVMAQARLSSALPRFQLRWSDLAISLAGAGLAFAAARVWQRLTLTDMLPMRYPEVYLWLQRLRLEVLLLTRDLALAGDTLHWILLSLAGLAIVVMLAWAARELTAPYPVGSRSHVHPAGSYSSNSTP